MEKNREIEPVIMLMIAFVCCEPPRPGFSFLDCVHNKHVLCNDGGVGLGGGGGIVQGESEVPNGTIRFSHI